MHRASQILTASCAILAGVLLGLPSCGSSDTSGFGPAPGEDGGNPVDGSFIPRPGGGDGGKPCNTGLCLQRVTCPGGGDTTLTGTVYDPAGNVPLYNALVFVPNAKLETIPTGASCDRCDSGSNVYTGDPVSSAVTDAFGNFTLKNVPVGEKIPVVVQIGKWRREHVTVNVPACTETKLTKEQTHLPRNRGEGSIPHIAIATGGADSMECLPIRMGLDPKEFSTRGQDGRIHLYQGKGGATVKFDSGTEFASANELWSSTDTLKAYDMVILSCEGGRFADDKPPATRNALYAYESMGGRVFASHWHEIWFRLGPAPVPSIGSWNVNEIPENDRDTQLAVVNDSFPKGKAFAQWLKNVGATPQDKMLPIQQARDIMSAVTDPRAQDWATIPQYVGRHENGDKFNANPPKAVQFVSYNAPLDKPEAEACGRAVYTNLHVSAGARADHLGKTFPTQECVSGPLSEQEKALEFMLFDLSSCISKDTEPPPPPVIH
ncbi:carboxypeptidase-like regulatory domain-containing protein [Pendulispora albinea]|uniref:Carboxypeptidase-like regulatory domain-containing protein n=1 Tax=Pendulispora albinea TaxID=2741071 RepID=A0ABZ2M8A8_9BACT